MEFQFSGKYENYGSFYHFSGIIRKIRNLGVRPSDYRE